MVKTYKAIASQVCMPIVINGCVVRIEFSPVSNYYAGQGGSEYSTANPLIQEALEKNPDFGNVYSLLNSEGELVTHIEEEEVPQEHPVELATIKVSSLSDAKIWLVDNKGWEPKGRVTKKTLQDVAASYGIQFEGID